MTEFGRDSTYWPNIRFLGTTISFTILNNSISKLYGYLHHIPIKATSIHKKAIFYH